MAFAAGFLLVFLYQNRLYPLGHVDLRLAYSFICLAGSTILSRLKNPSKLNNRKKTFQNKLYVCKIKKAKTTIHEEGKKTRKRLTQSTCVGVVKVIRK